MAAPLSKRYAHVTTIAQAFTLPEAPLAKVQGDVHGTLVMHLSALARFLNLRSTLTEEHIEFIADTILTDEYYKWLKPADIKLFFDRIKTGKYGNFYGNLNSIEFFQALDRYMIERNAEIEQVRMREKAEHQRITGGEEQIDIKALGYTVDKDGHIVLSEERKERAQREAQEAAEARQKKIDKDNDYFRWKQEWLKTQKQ